MSGVASLPARYAWLAKEPGPLLLLEALKLFGTIEAAGSKNNPTILGWAREVGVDKAYSNDAIPWCGLFMAVIVKRTGRVVVDQPLWALSWARFGVASFVPSLGDILTFKRNGGGHVALYVGEDASAYHCLGGNQSDQVCITRIAKARLFCARSPIYSKRPANVRRVQLGSQGSLSQNEA